MTLSHSSKLAYSAAEAAELLGVCRSLIYDEINRGKLRTFRAGGRRLISAASLRSYIETGEAQANLPKGGQR